MRGTHSVECTLLPKISGSFVFYIDREIWISVAHILGKNNTQADGESRVFLDN